MGDNPLEVRLSERLAKTATALLVLLIVCACLLMAAGTLAGLVAIYRALYG